MLEPAELRRLSLASAAAEDTHVAEALRTGDIWIRHAVATWESSEGTISGHLVGIGLDVALFARIAPDPSEVDALTVAVAEAIAQKPLESLCELRIHWNGAIRSAGHYRGDSLHVGLVEALEIYFSERGEDDVAERVRKSHLAILSQSAAGARVPEITVTLELARDRDFRAAAEALTLLLSGPDAVRVRVVRLQI